MNELYKISRQRLVDIADRVRVMAGTTRKMSPAEIIEWLHKVQFMPMGRANSEFAPTCKFTGTATGRIPVYQKGTAESTFTLPMGMFSSTAVGEVTE